MIQQQQSTLDRQARGARLPIARLAITVGAVLVAVLGFPQAADAQSRKRRKSKPEAGGAAEAEGGRATIVTDRGREIDDCEIKEEKFKKIRYRVGRGRLEEIDGATVTDIIYDEPHPSFSTGVSQMRAGLYDKAIESFTAARNAAKDGTWQWFHATFWLGEAMRMAGKSDDAVKEYERFLTADAEHYLAPRAILGLGKAQAGARKFSEADKSFAKLDDGWGDTYSVLAKLGQGDAALAANDPAKARQAYKIAGDRARDPDLKRAAAVGTGKTYVADKRWDDAIKFFDDIIREPGVAPDVAGGAWVGKGDCRMQQAKEKGDDKNLLKEALIAYETCAVRYAGTPDAYPKALYQASILYDKLGLPKLAEAMRTELKGRCPSSPWAEKLGK